MATKNKVSSVVDSTNNTVVIEECFVIMPISDQPGYESGHFGKVYDDLFKPACDAAGYRATRADEVKESNLIHLDILKRVVHSPIAICDLSSRNPNVLFELGLRQAFDKPTILVKDDQTSEIFDIAPIRYTSYRHALRYREVLQDQMLIADAIKSTREAVGKAHNVNSLVRLLEISGPAKISDSGAPNVEEYFRILMAEMDQLRREVRSNVEGSALSTSNRRMAGGGGSTQGRSAVLREQVRAIEQALAGGKAFADVEPEVQRAIAFAKKALLYYQSADLPTSKARYQSVMDDLATLETIDLL